MIRLIEGKGLEGTVRVDGVWLDPRKSLAIRNHSETGFAWGYGGSGPSQLALALLLIAEQDIPTVLGLYHTFKEAILAKLPVGGDFSMRLDLEQWVEENREDRETWIELNRRAGGGQ